MYPSIRDLCICYLPHAISYETIGVLSRVVGHAGVPINGDYIDNDYVEFLSDTDTYTDEHSELAETSFFSFK
ncbi:hypothetical protein AB6D92_02515 [Vibrio splendidus]